MGRIPRAVALVSMALASYERAHGGAPTRDQLRAFLCSQERWFPGQANAAIDAAKRHGFVGADCALTSVGRAWLFGRIAA
jgi:hypothetical protein